MKILPSQDLEMRIILAPIVVKMEFMKTSFEILNKRESLNQAHNSADSVENLIKNTNYYRSKTYTLLCVVAAQRGM